MEKGRLEEPCSLALEDPSKGDPWSLSKQGGHYLLPRAFQQARHCLATQYGEGQDALGGNPP